MSIYKPRPIRFIELMDGSVHSSPNLRFKLYGVTAQEEHASPRDELVRAAKTVAFDRLSKFQDPSIPESPLSVAVACVHEANGADFLLISQWRNGNELHTDVSQLDSTLPGGVVPRSSLSVPLCTWDLALLAFERGAWVEKVLKNPTSAGIEAYLSHVLNTTI